MKLLFTRFPLESRFGGAEVQTLSLMKGLRERSHAIAFLGSCPVLLEEVAKLQLPNAQLDIGPPPVTKWSAISFSWRKKRMQERLHAALNAFGSLDAIFMLSLSEKLLMTEAAVEKSIKVFWMEHDRVERWLTKNPWLPTLRNLSKKVKTICVSALSRKIYLDLGWRPEDVIAIPNGIDLDKFHSEGRRETGDGRLQLGCVARLSPEKGVDVLAEAVKDLPDVLLIIVGTGPQRARVIELSNQRVSVVPHVDNLADFYRSLDVFVLPSRDNDPFGLVAAEAMACGTPVIVTDQCGIVGYLSDGIDALIVKADSEEALRHAINRMRDESFRVRLADGARKKVIAAFTAKGMIDAYEHIIKK